MCGEVRCGAVRRGAARCGAVRCGVARHGMVWYGMLVVVLAGGGRRNTTGEDGMADRWAAVYARAWVHTLS